MCGIEDQIKKHCDEEEILCPACSSTMKFDDLRPCILVCECSHKIDTEELGK